jgi:uncharacterized membrane protein YcaP (DUF421 family)
MKNQEAKLNIFDYIVAFICADFISASIITFMSTFNLWALIMIVVSAFMWNSYERFRISWENYEKDK